MNNITDPPPSSSPIPPYLLRSRDELEGVLLPSVPVPVLVCPDSSQQAQQQQQFENENSAIAAIAPPLTIATAVRLGEAYPHLNLTAVIIDPYYYSSSDSQYSNDSHPHKSNNHFAHPRQAQQAAAIARASQAGRILAEREIDAIKYYNHCIHHNSNRNQTHSWTGGRSQSPSRRGVNWRRTQWLCHRTSRENIT